MSNNVVQLCIVKTDETKWRKEISVVLEPPPQLHKTSHRQTFSYDIFERMLVGSVCQIMGIIAIME